MRRQTTKQPSGPATMASPRPNSRARNRKGCSIGSAALAAAVATRWSAVACLLIPIAGARLSTAVIYRARRPGQVVAVIVPMLVDAEGARRLRAEQTLVLGMLGHRPGHP